MKRIIAAALLLVSASAMFSISVMAGTSAGYGMGGQFSRFAPTSQRTTNMDTLEFHAISGRDMIQKFGYEACPR